MKFKNILPALLISIITVSMSGCTRASQALSSQLADMIQSEIASEAESTAETEYTAAYETTESPYAVITGETETSNKTSEIFSETSPAEPDEDRPSVNIESVERSAGGQLQITWSGEYDDQLQGFHIMRRIINGPSGIGDWEELAYVTSEEEHIFTDISRQASGSVAPVQVQYRVDADSEDLSFAPGKPYLTSDFMLCIDPGHYAGVNAMETENGYGYAEGDFTIKISRNLQAILTEEYGIFCNMTREGGEISINGYSDGELDNGHLSLRGAYAAEYGSDFFMSIHTNGNQDDANGYPTLNQPMEANKTVVLANTLTVESEVWLNVANSVGRSVSEACFGEGIMKSADFEEASVGAVPTWTDEKNDSMYLPGGVMCRIEDGEDYYGVLRGSANVGVPGIIVEHCIHTVEEFRYKAMFEDFELVLARADADGIAKALGFLSEAEIK